MEDIERGASEEKLEKFGIGGDTAHIARAWAKEWCTLIEDIDVSNLTVEYVLAAREHAARELGDTLKRDVNGVPSFRATFAATELLYEELGNAGGELRDKVEGTGLHPVPHFDRLEKILDILLEQRKGNKFPYYLDAAQLPQDERNMPVSLPRGGVEHANFLFASCYYMRGGIKSTTAFRNLSVLYDDDPDLFDPHKAKHRDPATITESLQVFGLAFSKNIIAKQWVRNAERLS